MLTGCRLILVCIIACICFTVTSVISRHGDYVVNGARLGDSEYRDVRGIPFVFLKRSLADGECDIQDVQLKTCNPAVGNEPHQISVGFMIADIATWLGVASVIMFVIVRLSASSQTPNT
jgi:hypothetical protein